MLLEAVRKPQTQSREDKHVWTGHHFGSVGGLGAFSMRLQIRTQAGDLL